MLLLLALLFLLAAILTGVLVTGIGMRPTVHIRLGLRILFLSYLLGITFLVIALTLL